MKPNHSELFTQWKVSHPDPLSSFNSEHKLEGKSRSRRTRVWLSVPALQAFFNMLSSMSRNSRAKGGH